MPRLIDAEAFAEKVYRAWDLWEKKENDCFVFSDIITPMLISMPTVDAEPVVRCKDCMYLEPSLNSDWSWCCYFDSKVRNEDFCSHGERKEDAYDR